jgi:hypothetical protein
MSHVFMKRGLSFNVRFFFSFRNNNDSRFLLEITMTPQIQCWISDAVQGRTSSQFCPMEDTSAFL